MTPLEELQAKLQVTGEVETWIAKSQIKAEIKKEEVQS